MQFTWGLILQDVKNLKFVYTDSGPATVSENLAGHFMAKGVLCVKSSLNQNMLPS